MREARLLFVAVLCSNGGTARAETVVAGSSDMAALCRNVAAELLQVGMEIRKGRGGDTARRARRRAFASPTVDALVVCDTRPERIDAYYPDGSRLGALAFTVEVSGDPDNAAVETSERVRSERFVAEVPVPVPYAPPIAWLGLSADVLISPGGVAPVALVAIEGGYRFHRRWSASLLVSVQPYVRTVDVEGSEARLRADQFGGALAFHPLVHPRVDLSLAGRVTGTRLGVRGVASDASVSGQRDAAWTAFPAGRLTLRVGVVRQVWLRVQGEVGALVPRVNLTADGESFASLGTFAAQAGFGVEVHFR